MAEGLAVVLVRSKSKTICAPRFVVLFNVSANLFCTIAAVAPFRRLSRVPEGWQAAGQPGGGVYPPIDSI